MEDLTISSPFGSNSKIIGEMVAGRTVEQKFVAIGTCLESVRLKVGTYKRKNIGNMIEVSVFDESGDMVTSKTVNPRTFNDFFHNEVKIGCPVESMKNYTICIRSISGIPGRCITFICGKGCGGENHFFSVDGESRFGIELFCNLIFSDRKIAEDAGKVSSTISYADEKVPSDEPPIKTKRKRKRKDVPSDYQQV